MRWIRWIFLSLMMCAAARAESSPAVGAALAVRDAPRGEHWETLAVHVVVPPGGARVSVRDARGGVTVSRDVEAGAGGEVLIALPYVAGSELAEGVWPIEVRVGGSGPFERVEVIRAMPAESGRYRVAVVRDAAGGEPALRGLSALPVVTASVSAAEVTAGPPLVFAGFDAVAMPDTVAARVEESRLLALIAAGARVVVIGERPKTLGQFAWQSVGAGGKMWVVPALAFPALSVIEPALASSRVLQVEASANGAVRGTVALVPLGAIVLVLVARGLFRRPWSALLACAVVLMALTGAWIRLVQKNSPEKQLAVGWSLRAGTPAEREGGARVLTERETVHSEAALFAHSLNVAAEEGTLLLPVAPDARTYFAWQDAQLILNVDGAATPRMAMEARIPARHAWAYLERSASLTFAEQSAGWAIEDGYVNSLESPGEKQLLTAFASAPGEDRRAMRNSLLAWYDLRFDAAHRYVLHRSDNSAADIVVDDLGVSASGTP
jgi:hypothetical protein